MEYIYPQPFTRINETWADASVDCRLSDVSLVHPLIQGKSTSFSTRLQANFYKHIAVDIVAETVYNYRYPCITEKTLRPIACKRLFIIVGAPGSLALLQRKGFKTFSHIFDETYDTIIDPVQRWHALEKVIGNFVTKPLPEIIDIVNQNSALLDHNFAILKNLQEVEIKELNDTN